MFKKFVQSGNPFIVDVQKQTSGYYCLLQEEGRADLSLAVESFEITGSDTFRIVTDRGAHNGTFAIAEGRYYLHLDGHTFILDEAGLDTDAAGGKNTHRSPMPGKILAVHVATGDTVDEDDTLVVVEAMKMENAIKASLSGTVTAVNCQVGDVITPEMVLVELEPG